MVKKYSDHQAHAERILAIEAGCLKLLVKLAPKDMFEQRYVAEWSACPTPAHKAAFEATLARAIEISSIVEGRSTQARFMHAPDRYVVTRRYLRSGTSRFALNFPVNQSADKDPEEKLLVIRRELEEHMARETLIRLKNTVL